MGNNWARVRWTVNRDNWEGEKEKKERKIEEACPVVLGYRTEKRKGADCARGAGHNAGIWATSERRKPPTHTKNRGSCLCVKMGDK